MDKEQKEYMAQVISDMVEENKEKHKKAQEELRKERNGQPISKREFVEILNHLKEEDELYDKLNDAIDKVNPGFRNMFYPQSNNHTIIINLLSRLFRLEENEKYGTDIDYFIYDLEWGKEAEEFTFEDKGKNWVLKTPEDLYDYLIYKEK